MSDEQAAVEEHTENLRAAIELMSALRQAYADAAATGEHPEATLMDYITSQMVGKDEEIPPKVWGLLSGFGTLTYILQDLLEDLTNEPKQELLDRLADGSRDVIARAFEKHGTS